MTNWAEFWEVNWDNYNSTAEAGLVVEMQPMIDLMNKELATFIAGVKAGQGDDDLGMMEAREFEREINLARELMATRAKRHEIVLARGMKNYKLKKFEQANDDLSEAFRLSNYDFLTRVHLGWTQSELRKKSLKERLAYAAKPWTAPSAAVVKRNAGTLTASANDPGKRRQVEALLGLVPHVPALADIDVRSLERIHRRAKPTRMGVVQAMVTKGGEFTDGELLPVSVILGKRTDLNRMHELIYDNRSNVDETMRQSLVQALTWLDREIKGKLLEYKVTLQFQDLTTDKGGDSAGAAFAVAGYSSLFEIPVPQDLAMTGSVRAYGDVTAVGGVIAKVDAAKKEGCALVISPEDNAPELRGLPLDTQRAVRLVSAGDIKTYLAHVFGGGEDGAAIAASDTLYWSATVLEQLDMLPQALELYQRVAETASNDISTSEAVKRLKARGIRAKSETWMKDLGGNVLSAGGGGVAALRITKTSSKNDKDALQPIASTLAKMVSHGKATGVLVAEQPQVLLDLALWIDEENRDALLVQGRIITKGTFAPDPDPAGLQKTLTTLLDTRARLLAGDRSEDAKRMRAMFYWIINTLDPNHEQSLMAMATYMREFKKPPDGAKILADLQAGGGAAVAPAGGVAMERTADGSFYTAWCTSHSPSGIICLSPTRAGMSYESQHSSGGHLIPVPGTKLFVSGSGKVFNTRTQELKAIDVPLYADLRRPIVYAISEERIDYYSGTSMKMIGSLPVPGMEKPTTRSWAKNKFTTDRHFFPNADAKTIVQVDTKANKLIFHTMR